MEEAPENGKESSHSAHANGVNEMNTFTMIPVFWDILPSVGKSLRGTRF
jgi:hypothetical protein